MKEEKKKSGGFEDPDFVHTWDDLRIKYGSWEQGTKIWDTSRFLVSQKRGEEVAEEIRNGVDPDIYNPKELYRAQRIFVTRGEKTMYQLIQEVCKKRVERQEFDERGNWKTPDQVSL